MRHGRRHLALVAAEGVWRAAGADPDGDAAAHAGAVRAELEDAYVPSPEKIADAVREVAGAATASAR